MKKDTEFSVSAAQTEEVKVKKQNIFKSRKFKYGSLATALTAIFIVVVIAFNMVLSVLSDTYAWSFDLTSTDLYSMSDNSKQVVNSLEDGIEIKITIFYPEQEYPEIFGETIKRFSNLSDKISYKYIDPEKNPGELDQYTQDENGQQYTVEPGAVVVECGKRMRVFNLADYATVDEETGAVTIYLEERLLAGVLYVSKEQAPIVYLVGGHGESGAEALASIMVQNGAQVEEIQLTNENYTFSAHSKVMIICNPQKDFSETEIRKIEDFLNNDNNFGRNLMYFSSADAPKLPNIEKLIESWGIRMNDEIIHDDKNGYLKNTDIFAAAFTSEEILNSSTIVSSDANPRVALTRSLDLLFEEHDLYKTQKLITSSDIAYARKPGTVVDEIGQQEGEKNGVYTLAALAMKYKYVNNLPVQSYMFVSGSTQMLEATHLNYTGNAELLMKLYKIMVDEQDDTIVAAQKYMSSKTANVTAPQMNTMAIIVLAIIPVIFLILGLIVYIRRRFL